MLESMLSATGLDFTVSPELFRDLQNRGEELLISAGRRLMQRVRSPFVLIVTCDRAEAIAEAPVPHEALERALLLNPIAVSHARYSIPEEETIRHAFLLASGIISPLFGEDTVQGQIGEAAAAARIIGSSSPYLDKLLNMAVAFSKRMHTGQKLRVFDQTIVDAVAKRVKGCRRLLIVGSGEAARAIAAAVSDCHDVSMTLRDPSKTFLTPPGVAAVPYEERMKMALSSDAVISASSGLYLTFSSDEISRLGGRLLFDLSSPPDLPDAEGIIRIPDLGVDEPEKRRIIGYVEKEAEKEALSYASWIERSRSMPEIGIMADGVAYEAMRRLSGVISSLSLPEEDDRSLRESVLDSVRKAYIAKTIGRK